jgi:hypothetical protein
MAVSRLRCKANVSKPGQLIDDLPPKKWTGLSRSALGLGWADVSQG